MTETPLVSVVLPTRNRADTLARAIRSVLDQSFDNFELIVVDDASTDGTSDLIASLDDPRLTYLRLDTPRGGGGARNLGIEKSQSPLLSFQDSDDVWLPGKLERQVRALEAGSSEAGVCVCSIEYDLLGQTFTNIHGDEEIEGKEATRRIVEGAGYGTPTLLLKREVIETVGGFEESLPRLQDYEFTLRISKRWNFVLIPQPLVHANVGEDSLSKSADNYTRAISIILDKHKDTFRPHRRGHSRLVFRAGKYLAGERRYRAALPYFARAFRIHPVNVRALAAVFLAATGAYGLFNRTKD